jgi:hypothetical protein
MNQGCLDENLIADFIGGALATQESVTVREHIDRCSLCHQLLDALVCTAAAPPPAKTRVPMVGPGAGGVAVLGRL